MDHKYVINIKHIFHNIINAKRAHIIVMALVLTIMVMSLHLIHHISYVHQLVHFGMELNVYNVHILNIIILILIYVRNVDKDKHITKYKNNVCNLDIIQI